MTLFINNFVTLNARTRYDRLNLASFDRLDIWKYTLASYAAIPWDQVIVYSELDAPFQHRREELDLFIKELFPNVPLSIYHTRNTKQSQWNKALEEVTSPLIWLACNDDHPFIGHELDTLSRAKELLSKEQYATCYYSHWPEIIKVAQNESFCSDLRDHGDFVSFIWDSPDSIQIFTTEQLKKVFSTGDHEYKHLPRPDWIDWIQPEPYRCYVPLTEWCRHFDGYSHIAYNQTHCPPLSIPPGFFEKNIKILYLTDEKRDGWVTVNPASEYNTYATNTKGPHETFLLDEMPLFWVDRVSEIEVVGPTSDPLLLEKRNQLLLKKGLSPHHAVGRWAGSPPTNQEWIERGYR